MGVFCECVREVSGGCAGRRYRYLDFFLLPIFLVFVRSKIFSKNFLPFQRVGRVVFFYFIKLAILFKNCQ